MFWELFCEAIWRILLQLKLQLVLMLLAMSECENIWPNGVAGNIGEAHRGGCDLAVRLVRHIPIELAFVGYYFGCNKFVLL